MSYLLDANVFITASRLHYGLDFCPGFWDWLIERNAAEQVFSIERVPTRLRAVTTTSCSGPQRADHTSS